jgi:probable F420-dependent oxidoreductase
MQKRLGLTVGFEGQSLRDGIALCRFAEESGYTDAWSAEVGGADGFAALAAVAATTSSLRLGTAIVPVFTRPPALLAMGAATVQDISDGRFVLGLGTSSDIIVEKWMGSSFDKPITRLREYVQATREALAGKKVSLQGSTTRMEGFRLQLDPRSNVPIYIAALGPRACRLAGEIADGVIFFLKTPEGVARSLELVAEGARSAGRDPASIDCVIRVTVALDEDPDVLGFMARRLITTYAMVDVYNRSLSDQGFAAEMTEIATAWKAGERDRAAAAVTDELIDRLMIRGDRDACLARIDEFRAAGVKTPVLLPVSVAGDPAERLTKVKDAIGALAP